MSRKMIDYKVEDGKITSIDGYEVGGGGSEESYTVAVTNVTLKSSMFAITTNTRWVDGASLQPNTAYEVGDIVKIECKGIFQSANLETTNKIFVPVSLDVNVTASKSRLQFGTVILVLTHATSELNCSSSDNKIYDINCNNTLTYAVVKAGTTSDSVEITDSGFTNSLKYNIVTLGVTKVTE